MFTAVSSATVVNAHQRKQLISKIKPHTAHTTHYTSHTTHYTSHLTPHTSHLKPHTSHLTPHTSQYIITWFIGWQSPNDSVTALKSFGKTLSPATEAGERAATDDVANVWHDVGEAAP
jgi:hypothetical protein